jgi:hypothetical protein
MMLCFDCDCILYIIRSFILSTTLLGYQLCHVIKQQTQFAISSQVTGVTKCRTIKYAEHVIWMAVINTCTQFWTKKPQKRDNLRDWGTDGRTTVKGSCKIECMNVIGVSWLRTGSGGESLWASY